VTAWHIITGEYPPQPGGVSDYTRLVARGLAAAGDPVTVWAPPIAPADPQSLLNLLDPARDDSQDPGIELKRLPDRFGARSLRLLSETLNRARTPHRVLVQYVPHAFGWKAANVPFCLWLRSRRRDSVWVMFHEVAFPFNGRDRLTLIALAAVNRLMAALVGQAAERAFVSIPAWRAGVGAVTAAGTPVTWLPVPSGIAVAGNEAATAGIRTRYGDGRSLVGHFGTYGTLLRPLLDPSVVRLIELSGCRVLLLGKGSQEACREIVAKEPRVAGSLIATGALPAEELSHHVSACDVMLQPYPDGVSSRRTSAMVALVHRVPMVTTHGVLTEPIWQRWDAAEILPASDIEGLAAAAALLLTDPVRRAELAGRAAAMYDEQFDVRHTISALRSTA
jgi:glycosyltransferase involved in cell wall biosynthesis